MKIGLFIKIYMVENSYVFKKYLLLSWELVKPRVWGGIDLLYLDCPCCVISSLCSIVDLGFVEGVVSKYSLVGGVLKLADVTNERKASNWRNDKALWRVSKGRTIGIPTERAINEK